MLGVSWDDSAFLQNRVDGVRNSWWVAWAAYDCVLMGWSYHEK